MKIVSLEGLRACAPGTFYHVYADTSQLPQHDLAWVKRKPLLVKGKSHENGMVDVFYVGRQEGLVRGFVEVGDQHDIAIPTAGSDFTQTYYPEECLFEVWEPAEMRALLGLMKMAVKSAAREPMVVPADTPEVKKTKWLVDEWLDYGHLDCVGDPALAYVHLFLTLHRMSAADKSIHGQFTNQFKLFADYDGQTWEITGASRMGDIYLKALDSTVFYDHRVTLDFAKFSNWRRELGEIQENPESPLMETLRERDRQYSNTWAPGVVRKPQPVSKVKTSGRHYKCIGTSLAEPVHLPEGGVYFAIDPADASLLDAVGQQKVYIRTK